MALLLFGASLAWAIDPLPFESTAQEQRFQALTAELRCMKCQNQNLADSSAEIAGDMRKKVFDLMQSGQSDEQIKLYLVARYGDFVLYNPRFSLKNSGLWLLPGLCLVAGIGFLFGYSRRRDRAASSAGELEAAQNTGPAESSARGPNALNSEDW